MPEEGDLCEDCGQPEDDCADDCRCDPCVERAAEDRAAAYECGG